MKLEEEIEKETLFDISRVETRLIHESESCIHEAIVPVVSSGTRVVQDVIKTTFITYKRLYRKVFLKPLKKE